jgi:hypothetical protein
MAFTLAAYSQQKNLSTVNSVKPKKGQKTAFEAAYKTHIAKFHKPDAKINVYEILSGPYAGYYHLVNGGRSFADFDNDRPDAAAHDVDLDKSFYPFLEESKNLNYRMVDTLSFHGDMQAEKFIVNVRHIKSGKMDDYVKETRRGILVLNKMKGNFWNNLSFVNYIQLWSGNDPVIVTVRGLKDGFASLESNFYGQDPAGTPTYKDVYIQIYGTLDWENRTKIMDDLVLKNEAYIMKYRKDMSTQ